MNKVSNLALQNITLANIQALQTRMAEKNIQITTGKKGQRFADIAPDAKRLVNLEAAHLQLTQFTKNNALVDSRLQTMETNVSQMFDIASKLRTSLVQALNADNAQDMALTTMAQDMLNQVASLLNVQDDGRYLFAGSKTDTAPVDLSDPTFLPPPSAYPSSADTNYYQGDAVKLAVRADISLTVSYGVTADEAGFEQLIRALHLVATAVMSPATDTPRLNEAMTVVLQAIDNLPQIQSRIGAARASIETANRAHDDTLLYTEKTIGELENVDLTEAITLLSADQLTLEASFAALAQARRVSLLDFL